MRPRLQEQLHAAVLVGVALIRGVNRTDVAIVHAEEGVQVRRVVEQLRLDPGTMTRAAGMEDRDVHGVGRSPRGSLPCPAMFGHGGGSVNMVAGRHPRIRPSPLAVLPRITR